jgi:hypothetical protein
MPILLPSVQSLFIEMRLNGQKLASGTAFVANAPRGPVLITNRHNATGRHNTTGEYLSPTGYAPDQIAIAQNRHGCLGEWLLRMEPLFDIDENKLWIEHPTLGATADFVALPLTDLDEVQLYPYSLDLREPDIAVRPSDNISVVGFPFGLSGGGGLAILATGFVATEPEVDQNDLPTFLIDCRARQGQSGSAVIAHRNGGMVPLENGGTAVYSGPITRFLGIYSGRINEQSDLGIVWKTSAIRDLVETIR